MAAFLIRTPIFEWFVVWCGSKNGYQTYMFLKEIGLHTQWGGGGMYDHLMRMRIFSLIMNRIFIQALSKL